MTPAPGAGPPVPPAPLDDLRSGRADPRCPAGAAASLALNTHYPNQAVRIADKCFLLGERGHRVGSAADVMTDANMEEYFGVRSQTLYASYEGEEVPSFVFLDEA